MDPPTQIVCDGRGCVAIEGSGLTITAAMFDVIREHPPELKLIVQ
jgi:hypothetical protein